MRKTRTGSWWMAAAALAAAVLSPCLAQPAPLQLPEFEEESLLNGMEIFFLPTRERDSKFLLMIRNGAAFDPVGKWGATLLMARMMLASTEGRTPEQMRFALDSLGAQIEPRVEYDAIYFQGSAPAVRMPEALALLADVVTRPDFTEESFQAARSQLLEQRQRELQSARVLTREMLHEELFLPHPYGRPIGGTLESLDKITLNDVKIQYRRLVMPNQAQLAFYHSGDRERTFRDLSRSWGGWVGREALPFTFRRAEPAQGAAILLNEAPAEEAILRWGNLGVSKLDPDYHPLKVFEQYLLLSLPDWAAEVESKQHIQAVPEVVGRRMRGYVSLSIRSQPDHLQAYLRELLALIGGLKEGNVDAERLEEAKQLALQDFLDGLKGGFERLQALLDMRLYEIGAGYITTYGLRVSRITPRRFAAVVKRHLSSEDFVAAVAGPRQELEKRLAELGEIR